MKRNQPDTELPKTPKAIKYIANITQSGTANPTQKILHNPENLEVTLERNDTGLYTVTISSLPNIKLKDCATIQLQQTEMAGQVAVLPYNNLFNIFTWNGTASVDGIITDAAMEITIYTDKL